MQKLVTLQFSDFLKNQADGSNWPKKKKKKKTRKMSLGKLRMKYPT